MLALVLLELSLREVLADLPHDGGALVVYTMLALIVAFVWAGSRRSRTDSPPKREDHVH